MNKSLSDEILFHRIFRIFFIYFFFFFIYLFFFFSNYGSRYDQISYIIVKVLLIKIMRKVKYRLGW